MQPILFTISRFNINLSSDMSRGVHPPMLGFLPLPQTKLLITGVTKDSSGTILGSCTVSLFRTIDDMFFEKVVSNATTGDYSFSAVGLSETYYVVAYKTGSPDVAGTTRNDLVGVM